MRKLKLIEHVSLDGVIETGPNFAYGDWGGPYRTPEGLAMMLTEYGETFDLLLGRTTYDLLGNFWPKAPSSPAADRLNAAHKYVVTHRPDGLAWGPAGQVKPDLAEGVRALKAAGQNNLLTFGSSTITSTLLQLGLVDEVILLMNPVLLGTGKRFFSEGTPACTLALDSTRTSSTGIVVAKYRYVGPLPKR